MGIKEGHANARTDPHPVKRKRYIPCAYNGSAGFLRAMGHKVPPALSSAIELVVKIISAAFLVPAIGYLGVAAPFYLSKPFAPWFSEGGSIINISSSRDPMSQPQTESYMATTAGNWRRSEVLSRVVCL